MSRFMISLKQFFGLMSFEEALEAKAELLGDGPEHTLEYYERGGDHPYLGLADEDMVQIALWMEASETLPGAVGDVERIELSSSDLAQINHWMSASENLPKDYKPPVGFIESFFGLIDDLYGGYYLWKADRLPEPVKMEAVSTDSVTAEEDFDISFDEVETELDK